MLEKKESMECEGAKGEEATPAKGKTRKAGKDGRETETVMTKRHVEEADTHPAQAGPNLNQPASAFVPEKQQ